MQEVNKIRDKYPKTRYTKWMQEANKIRDKNPSTMASWFIKWTKLGNKIQKNLWYIKWN
jgi:hypothetical protein